MLRRVLQDLRLLYRVNVSLMVGGSAFFGYLLVRPHMEWAGLACAAATALLACACSAWNQAQERHTDILMARTANRPVAAGRMRPAVAVVSGAVCFIPATLLLYELGGVGLAFLAPGIALIYNGIYTPLKKVTGFALLAGAVVGALPPAIGWLSAGGTWDDPFLVLLYGVYLLWQIPHFWLRADRYAEEYRLAGFPVPGQAFAPAQYGRLLHLWFYAFVAALLMVPLFPFLQSPGIRIAVSLVGVLVLPGGAFLFRFLKEENKAAGAKAAFLLVDGTMLLVMGLVLVDHILTAAG